MLQCFEDEQVTLFMPFFRPPRDTHVRNASALCNTSVTLDMSVFDDSKVKHAQWVEIIGAVGLILFINGKFHILAVVDNEGIDSISVIPLGGCIIDCSLHLFFVKSSLRPCHHDVLRCLKEHQLPLLIIWSRCYPRSIEIYPTTMASWARRASVPVSGLVKTLSSPCLLPAAFF